MDGPLRVPYAGQDGPRILSSMALLKFFLKGLRSDGAEVFLYFNIPTALLPCLFAILTSCRGSQLSICLHCGEFGKQSWNQVSQIGFEGQHMKWLFLLIQCSVLESNRIDEISLSSRKLHEQVLKVLQWSLQISGEYFRISFLELWSRVCSTFIVNVNNRHFWRRSKFLKNSLYYVDVEF